MTFRYALVAGTAAITIACGGREPAAPARSGGSPIAVDVVAAVTRDRADVFEAGGVVRGHTSATMAARILAPVRAVLVNPGDRVRAGQSLLLLDDRDLATTVRQTQARRAAASQALNAARAEHEAMEAAVVLARASHERMAALYDRKSATAQELDEAQSTLRAAEARLVRSSAGIDEALAAIDVARAGADGAEVTASFARITAPFDGMVTEKLVEPGNLVAPGTPLLRIEDTRAFKLEVRVDESRASLIALDARVPILADTGAAAALEGRVTEIARAVDTDTRTFLVTIALAPAGTLRPGAFARARLPGPVRSVLTVPDRAIVRHGQLTNVFVVEQDTARVRMISIGRAEGGWTDVLAGLSNGERVVVAPPDGLGDGAALSVHTAKPPSPGGVS